MAGDPASQVGIPRRRYGLRLKILIGFCLLLFSLFFFSQLGPNQIQKLGPWGQSAYEVFNPPPLPEMSSTGRRLMADVKSLGGRAHGMENNTPRFLGLFGSTHTYHIDLYGVEFRDADLAQLVHEYGDSISELNLRHTKVTDEGLRYLSEMPRLQQLELGNDPHWGSATDQRPISPITDAGLAKLRDLPQLMNLNLSGLPITDAGLESLGDLPKLKALYLCRTRIQGPGMSRLKSLPRLEALYLDDSKVTDKGLTHLSGASSLRFLSLSRVPLTGEAIKPLKALPRLYQVDLSGCGFLDEEVDALRKSKPELKIER